MWFRLMLLALVLNGAGDFGLRVLHGLGYASGYTPLYLVGWYAAGATGAVAAVARAGVRPTRADWLIGLGLGVASVFGQSMLGLALARGVPGAVAYPAAKTGGVFLVAAVGLFAFRERIGPFGAVGVVLGLAGVLLLSSE
jgi:multidrug transporter EmrE-like cation transporter